jgi:hypothetical protein
MAAALQAEVAAYTDAHRGEVDAEGRRLVVRNGSHPEREVTTAAGSTCSLPPPSLSASPVGFRQRCGYLPARRGRAG